MGAEETGWYKSRFMLLLLSFSADMNKKNTKSAKSIIKTFIYAMPGKHHRPEIYAKTQHDLCLCAYLTSPRKFLLISKGIDKFSSIPKTLWFMSYIKKTKRIQFPHKNFNQFSGLFCVGWAGGLVNCAVKSPQTTPMSWNCVLSLLRLCPPNFVMWSWRISLEFSICVLLKMMIRFFFVRKY